MDTHKVTAPAYWASYLINGDASGFDYYNTPDDPTRGDRDLAQAQAFEAWAGGSILDAGESFFDVLYNVPTLGAFTGDVCEYTIAVRT